MNPRQVHAGKTPLQKREYIEALKVPMPANPTYKKHIEETTDIVQEPEIISGGSTGMPLRQYERESKIGLREVIIGIITIIGTVVGSLLVYYIVELSPQVAVLKEKVESINQRLDAHESDLKSNTRQLLDQKLEIELLKRSRKK